MRRIIFILTGLLLTMSDLNGRLLAKESKKGVFIKNGKKIIR